MKQVSHLVLTVLLLAFLTSCATRPDTIYYGTFSPREIKAVPIDGGKASTLAKGPIIDALVFDSEAEKIVVGNSSGKGAIITRGLDGSVGETLNSSTICERLATDPKRGHLYWIENTRGQGGRNTIHRCDLADGGNSLKMSLPEMFYIEDIAVDPRRKKLYWAAGRGAKQMWRSNLDGSGVEQIGSITNMTHLAVDYRRSRLYFIKTVHQDRGIYVAKLDGSEAKLLIPAKVYRYDDLIVDIASGRIFWSDRDQGVPSRIWSAKPNGSDVKLVQEESGRYAYIKAIALGKQGRERARAR